MNAEPLSPGHSFLVWTLIVLAALSTLGASLAIWTERQLLDTGEWTKSSSQLLADRNVRNFVAQQLVDELSKRTDLNMQLRNALPSRAKDAAPLASLALENASVRTVNAFLGSAQAQTLWRTINRQTHRELVAVLENKNPGRVLNERGEVVLDLTPLLLKVAKQLGVADRLQAHISPTTGKIALVRADELQNAQRAVRAIHLLSVWLALLAVALYGLAFYFAKGHRHGILEVSGVSLILVGLLLVVIRRMAGNAVIDAYVQTESYRPAVRSAWLIETRLLGEIAIALIAYGAAVIAAGFLGGSSRPAKAIRRALAPIFRQRRAVFHTGVVLLFLAILAWGPTGSSQRLFGLTVLAALVSVGIEVWRRQALREYAAGAGTRKSSPRSSPAKRKTTR